MRKLLIAALLGGCVAVPAQATKLYWHVTIDWWTETYDNPFTPADVSNKRTSTGILDMDINFGNYSYDEKMTCPGCWLGSIYGNDVMIELWYPAYEPIVTYYLKFGDDFGGDLRKINFDSFISGTAHEGYCAVYPCSVDSGIITQAAMPEPTTWAMLISGFALVGAVMRRRKVAASFA